MTRLKKVPKYDRGTGPTLSSPPVPTPTPTGSGSWLDFFGLTPINRGTGPAKQPSPTDLYNSIAPTIGAINNAIGGFTNAAGSTAAASNTANAKLQLAVQLGIPVQTAIALDQAGLLDYYISSARLSDLTGAGGSGGRTQFASEAELQQAQAAFEQARARQANLEADIISGGSRLTMGPGGLLIDKLTGQTVDPTSIGLARDKYNFESGPQFQENIRQFDTSQGTTRRGQDIESQLGNLNAKNAAERNAADAAIGFGNLGVARTDQIRQILSNPSDALARLYMQRGGASPVDQIKMADLLGAFNSQMQGIDNSYKSRLSAAAPPPAVGAPDNIFFNQPNTAPPTAAVSSNPVAAYDPGASGGPIYTGNPTDAERAALEEFARQGALANGHESGGYTTDKVFLGNEKGSELFLNPTGAPLTIVPHEQTTNLVAPNGKIKGHEDGTSAGPRTRLKPTPTGGFWNSFMEVMGELGHKAMKADMKPPKEIPNHADGTLGGYNTRLQGLKSYGSPYRGLNFQNYGQANGLDAYGQKIPELQYGYQAPSTNQQYSKYGPDTFRTAQQINDQYANKTGITYNNAGQDELVKLAEQALAPGARSALEGTPQAPLQIPGLNTPTPESLANLTMAEKQNLNTYLATKFNATFEDLMNQVQQRYQAPATRKSRLLV